MAISPVGGGERQLRAYEVIRSYIDALNGRDARRRNEHTSREEYT